MTEGSSTMQVWSFAEATSSLGISEMSLMTLSSASCVSQSMDSSSRWRQRLETSGEAGVSLVCSSKLLSKMMGVSSAIHRWNLRHMFTRTGCNFEDSIGIQDIQDMEININVRRHDQTLQRERNIRIAIKISNIGQFKDELISRFKYSSSTSSAFSNGTLARRREVLLLMHEIYQKHEAHIGPILDDRLKEKILKP